MKPISPRVHRNPTSTGSLHYFVNLQRPHPFIMLRRPKNRTRNQGPALSVCRAHALSRHSAGQIDRFMLS
jgi:hypothetical protein